MVRSRSGPGPLEHSRSDDSDDPTAAVDGLFVDGATEAADEPEDSAAAPSAMRPSSEPLPENERHFGRYTLLRRLAYGGMGEVFLARQGGAGSLAGVAKLVVIKRILGHMRRDERHRRMFLDEARLQALLSNPHVVQVHDMGEEQGHVYLAMEHVLGPSWRMIIDRMRARRTWVPLAHVCAMVAQAARGLSYAHNLVDVAGSPLRIVHRDINPHNVLVSYDGEVKIIDFGIAKSELQEGNTETGTIKGKFNYMSPEQSAALKLDNRSDIFTLGICLQELLTNENPFRRSNVVLSLEAIQKEAPVRVARRRPDAGLLQPIVDRCMAKDPEQRYGDALFLSEDLDELLASGAVPAPPEPLSSWLRNLFTDELAEHMHILEATGSAGAMVRRDGVGSSRMRAAPRAVSGVRAANDIADLDTKVSGSPLLDDPSFDVDSVSGEGMALPAHDDADSSQESTAATPSRMALPGLSSSVPRPVFEPLSDVPSTEASADDVVEIASVTGPVKPAPPAPELIALESAPAHGGRTMLVAAGVVLAVALVAGVGYAVTRAPAAPSLTPPVAPPPTAPPADTPTPDHDPPNVVTPPGTAAPVDPPPDPVPAPAVPTPTPDPQPPAPPELVVRAPIERAPRKNPRRDDRAQATVLGTVSVAADGLSVKGRRKVVQGEVSVIGVTGGPFEVRLAVRAADSGGATMVVESEPWAIVQVDSMGRGRTPVRDLALAAGKRVTLTFKSPKVPQSMSVSVTWTPAGG
ncbi:MAG: serine/threonine protein kinase [Deltaproteobacteria bacterium]|nr:serine/threonine protein kinase [Deltaproteobacteria bacterium]